MRWLMDVVSQIETLPSSGVCHFCCFYRNLHVEGDYSATGCNSRAGEAEGAGSESPTVLPESEDGLLRGVLARVPSRLRPSGQSAIVSPAPWIRSMG
jgi:hypothetical protein